jgi:hypothetical protein
MFFEPLGLALSEKQIPQVNENTEEAKWLLEPLESVGTRPRQARYQAALRPDMKCFPDSTALPDDTATPIRGFRPNLTTLESTCKAL